MRCVSLGEPSYLIPDQALATPCGTFTLTQTLTNGTQETGPSVGGALPPAPSMQFNGGSEPGCGGSPPPPSPYTFANAFHHRDHLGSLRVVTDDGGWKVSGEDYYAFGLEMLDNVGHAPPQGSRRKFTGHERDAQTGMDYMKARYYSSTFPRFGSVDRFAGSSEPMRGQSWNRYLYTEDSPADRVDASGLDWFYEQHNWQWHKGHEWKGMQGTPFLLKFTATGKSNAKGALQYTAVLLNGDNKQVGKTTFWHSGGAVAGIKFEPTASGNYIIHGGDHAPTATGMVPGAGNLYQTSPGAVQRVSPESGMLAAYGPMRANLAPMEEGLPKHQYLHTQELDPRVYGQAGATHGCMAANDSQGLGVIQFIWNSRKDFAVEVP